MSWERNLDNGKSNKREERRKQKDKKKQKAREIYPDDDHAETLVDHLKRCNPRKDGMKTRQELKMELNHLDSF